MAGFSQEIDVAVAREALFDFALDPDNAPKVLGDDVRMAQLSPGSLSVGTRFVETRGARGGKRVRYELTLTELQRPERYAMRMCEGGIEVCVRYALSPTAGGTRVRLDCEVRASGLKRLLAPLVAAHIRKQDGDQLQRLKRAAEAHA